MNIDPDKKELILRAIKDFNGSYEKVAKATTTSIKIIEYIDVTENKKYNFTKEGKGRMNLRKYIVAVRSLFDDYEWNNKDPKIAKARSDYEAGTHEMCTARDGMNLILYSIPRKKPVQRKPYFTTNVVELRVR